MALIYIKTVSDYQMEIIHHSEHEQKVKKREKKWEREKSKKEFTDNITSKKDSYESQSKKPDVGDILQKKSSLDTNYSNILPSENGMSTLESSTQV